VLGLVSLSLCHSLSPLITCILYNCLHSQAQRAEGKLPAQLRGVSDCINYMETKKSPQELLAPRGSGFQPFRYVAQ
jgi:hypothetical protein